MPKKHEVIDHRVYRVTVTICPADDKSGEWIGHVLDFDIVSQGSSPKAAYDNAVESAAMVVCDDLNENREPGRRNAPVEYWKALEKALTRPHEEVKLSQMDAKNLTKMYVAQAFLGFERVRETHNSNRRNQLAARRSARHAWQIDGSTSVSSSAGASSSAATSPGCGRPSPV